MNYWIKYITNILVLGSIFVGIYTAGEYVFYRVMPMSYWVEYKDVKPIKTEFSYDEDLIFTSIYSVRKKSDISYVDTLRCNIDTDYGYFSQYQSRGVGVAPQKYIKDINWTYQAEKPLPPRTCFLNTTIILELPYGIKKQQKIISDNFEII